MIQDQRTLSPAQIERDLASFDGTEHYWSTILPTVVTTDGVKYLAQECRAYWLVDRIACAAHYFRAEKFQTWKLVRDENGPAAFLSATDGNSTTLYQERIEFSDFPLREIKLFVSWGISGGERVQVLMLPSEY